MQVDITVEEAKHIKYLVEMSCRDEGRRTDVEKSLVAKAKRVLSEHADATTARDDEEARLLAEHRARSKP